MPGLLLDTHAALWMAEGVELSDAAREKIREAAAGETLLFSAVSAWELGLLEAKGRIRLSGSVIHWVRHLLDQPGIRGLPLSIEAGLEAANLPGQFHADPADRLLVATARVEDAIILTRDGRILDYAAAGHVRALAC